MDRLLLRRCSADPDWKAQEVLAKALAWRCEKHGWSRSEKDLRSWLGDERANVRRAAAVGTSRVDTPASKTEPDLVIAALQRWHDQDRDIGTWMAVRAARHLSKTHPDALELTTN